MNNDQLEKGLNLIKKIESLEKRLDIWNRSISISSVNISCKNTYDGISSDNLDGSYIEFKVLKILTMEAIKTELEKCKNEFEKL